MSALLALLIAACGPAAAQEKEAARRFDERAAAVEAGLRELELRAAALAGVSDLDEAARAEERRFKDLREEHSALDAAKRRYGVAARMAIASAVVVSVQESTVTKRDYETQMSRLERGSAMSDRVDELAVRIADAHDAFLRAVKSEQRRRRTRRAAAGLSALLAAAAAGAWAWFRVKGRPAAPTPVRPPVPGLPPRRGSGRLE